ncbi:MAG TPA: hypothetical protein VLZ83_08610 [Edaphocola sp.]|nr:hypothetical protein [Edaphocola sp.]
MFGQVFDVAPTVKHNILSVEGGGIQVETESLTPLNKLIERLNDNWNFVQTGKAYWIGYTEDMFSIASKGDLAIPALTDFFMNTKSRNENLSIRLKVENENTLKQDFNFSD